MDYTENFGKHRHSITDNFDFYLDRTIKISNLFLKTFTVYMKAFIMEEPMDKKFADEMIKKFQKKYFGFALALIGSSMNRNS